MEETEAAEYVRSLKEDLAETKKIEARAAYRAAALEEAIHSMVKLFPGLEEKD